MGECMCGTKGWREINSVYIWGDEGLGEGEGLG